jgi:hypothetical protein
MRARPNALAACAALAVAACQAPPPPAQPDAPERSPRVEEFAPGRAWRSLEALAAIGPRAVGTEGNRQARAYIVKQLERLRLDVVQQRVEVRVGDAEPFDLVNVAGRIPGASEDAIVLVAGYDTTPVDSFPYVGVNEAGSGPAVLLEMARVIAEHPLPYTTWVVFLDGQAPSRPGEPPRNLGSKAFASRLSKEGVLNQIRLALVIEKVCDPDLQIARDLHSQRIYREEFWQAAARLGYTDVFLPTSGYESPNAGHRPLLDAGLRRVVALVDTSFGGGEPPGVYAGTADDDLAHCSAQSLETVATVALEALDVISRRLAKIDRFAEAPVAEAQALAWDTLGEPQPEEPEPEEAPAGAKETAAGAEAAPSDAPAPSETASPPDGAAPVSSDTAAPAPAGASGPAPSDAASPAPSEGAAGQAESAPPAQSPGPEGPS